MSDSIKCPKCEKEHEIGEMELWDVYEEDGKETEINCPNCDADLIITSQVIGWSFETELRE